MEILRRPFYYMLSLFSVLIVVMATAAAQTIIDNTPVIFLKQAEAKAGEIDIIIEPNAYP